MTNVFWIKSDLPWRKLCIMGSSIYGIVAKSRGDGTFYVVYPDLGKISKVRFSGDPKDSKLEWFGDIETGQNLEKIEEFIVNTNRPCFIMDNGSKANEILARRELVNNSVDIYFSKHHGKFNNISVDKYKIRKNQLPTILLSIRQVREKDDCDGNCYESADYQNSESA